ncbi:MAG: SWIM zinc finger family protein [Acidobacteriota bacterium]
MARVYTRDQVLALAPDAASIKAAQKLLNIGKWPLLETDEAAVWGECKGSGKKPYLVQIDLSEPAFKCSCPSRKFPCKHGLALLLLLADSGDAFRQAPQPPRVADWLESRQTRVEKKAQRAAAKSARPVDPEALAKQQAKRRQAMSDGLEDFDLWLQDLIRQGLAALPGRDADYWRQPAARLVDAKAPGMARWIDESKRRVARGGDWPQRVMATLGQAYLLRRAFANYDKLTPEQQADVRTALGWTLDKEAVLEDEAIREPMRVLGRSVSENKRLREQRIWLQGQTSGRPALILDFAHGQQPFGVRLSPGTVVDLELAYYPSAVPLRALIKARHGEPQAMTDFHGSDRLEDALDQVAAALAGNPWLDRLPMTLRGMRLVAAEGSWLVVDGAGRALPAHRSFQQPWELLAVSGGRPLDLSGEWRPDGFMPLGCIGEEGYQAFACEEIQ